MALDARNFIASENDNHNTVNVEIFAKYIFSRISCRALDARKYDVSEKNESLKVK